MEYIRQIEGKIIKSMDVSQKIVEYAMWYYLRYYPSTQKLEHKLEMKFGVASENGQKYGGIGKEEIDYIVSEKLRNIIQEEEVCRSKISNLIHKSKNYFYIKNNLRQKLFDGDLVESILRTEFQLEEQSLLDEKKIYKKISTLRDKGKSRNYCRNKFVERSFDGELVDAILNDVYSDGEWYILEKEYEKLSGRYEKQKIIEKLLRKGFQYEDIKKIFDGRI